MQTSMRSERFNLTTIVLTHLRKDINNIAQTRDNILNIHGLNKCDNNINKSSVFNSTSDTRNLLQLCSDECDIIAVDTRNLVFNSLALRYSNVENILYQQHRKWWTKQFKNVPLQSCRVMWDGFDGYNLLAFNQTNGIWPIGHPLPLPDWAPHNDEKNRKGILHFDSVLQYEELSAIIETKLQRMLEETHYDTIHLFIDFYKAFKRTRRSDLKSFFQFYNIPINRRYHMCVSLAMEIMARIVELFVILQYYLYIVSCEEQIVSTTEYIEMAEEFGGLNSPHVNVEKDHAMVAMKINIAGRLGVLILDPGYHVGRTITVMHDQMYPHTGWFTKTKEKNLQRDYCYKYYLYNNKYVEWIEREIRDDQTTYKTSLIYIDQAYITAIDVTVRRNLVYNFRSLLSRDAKGRVFAGIYLPIMAECNDSYFTLFYDGIDQRVKTKFLFSTLKNASKLPDNIQQHIEKLAPQLKMTKNQLYQLLISLTEALIDKEFIGQTLAINNDINNMSAEN